MNCKINAPDICTFTNFSDIIAGIQANEEIHNENHFLNKKRSLRIGDKTDKQIITFPSRVRGTQFQLKSEEIAKKIPNADITFINGKEEKNIKKSENTKETIHSQTNEHLHKKR